MVGAVVAGGLGAGGSAEGVCVGLAGPVGVSDVGVALVGPFVGVAPAGFGVPAVALGLGPAGLPSTPSWSVVWLRSSSELTQALATSGMQVTSAWHQRRAAAGFKRG